ncbi:MAG: IS30 family transposase [Kineosporiaceae bacterium]
MMTLVERTTRYAMLVRVPYDRTAERCAILLAAKIATLPEFLRKSITWDQGKEMAAHAKFTIVSGVPVFFCDPHKPWQRGTNENTNGLLRQYGSSDFSVMSVLIWVFTLPSGRRWRGGYGSCSGGGCGSRGRCA